MHTEGICCFICGHLPVAHQMPGATEIAPEIQILSLIFATDITNP